MWMGAHHVLLVAFVKTPAVPYRHSIHIVFVCGVFTRLSDVWTEHEARFVSQVSVDMVRSGACVVSVHSLCSELLPAQRVRLHVHKIRQN
jgi:hypothetical protein